MPLHDRLIVLDVLRGIAILGTLGTNIWIFMYPGGLLGYLATGWGQSDDMHWGTLALQQLTQGKFLGLLALMFGMGIVLQQRSALAAGIRWPGPYLVRAALLFVDGVLNYLFVVEFDVLMGYAITSVVVAFMLRLGSRGRTAWLAVAAGVHFLFLGLVVLVLAFFDGDMPGGVTAATGSGWWDMVQSRVDNVWLFREEMFFIAPMSVALFLLGARLLEAGVFEARGVRLRRWLIVLGLGVAWPIDMAMGVFGGDAGIMAGRYGTAPFVAMGLLAAVAEAFHRRPQPGALGRRLAEVGRMALSGYVLQNLLASALCYDWGLGLARRVPEAWSVPATVGIYLLVAAGVMLFAHLWQRHAKRGPLEWLWHRSYLRLTRGSRANDAVAA
ncbi:DUF418 domain-containing protein [Pseudoxanthomonas sp. PXM01]|uniref:DUF418 domain-containing protein n=1 Tax=Pseudoxanthomonas sp. PXM01 TaxID=2769295 RepID=UPI00177AB483|nr:DUF418 domain-containing protein [Pseudoxanthomonas sp. PXM01]MBD9469918.1 DUF418 domain-containing protein [Pseudoxanthomonas sp. PXM01]